MWAIPDAWQNEIIPAILAFIVGILLEKYANRKPELPYYLLSISSFRIPPVQAGQVVVNVFTHSIVIQNTGKAPALNVEVVHFVITTRFFIYQISPDISFSEEKSPNGGLILRFPSLLPGQQITISYLYDYPYLANQIHNYVKSNEVFGYPINVLSVRHTSKWLQLLLLWLALFGLIYVIQLLWVGLVALVKFIMITK